MWGGSRDWFSIMHDPFSDNLQYTSEVEVSACSTDTDLNYDKI